MKTEVQKKPKLGTCHVSKVNEWVINGHNLYFLGLDRSTGHQTSNAAESETGGNKLI